MSVVTSNAISFVSFVSLRSGAAALAGSPSSFTCASPGNGALTVTLTNTCVFWPCSTAARSWANATSGGATSSVNSWLDTHTGPLPASDTAVTAVFHFRAAAFGAAFIGSSVSVPFSGITADPWMPMPGGVNSG